MVLGFDLAVVLSISSLQQQTLALVYRHLCVYGTDIIRRAILWHRLT